jgi:hypothetical protein
MRIHGERWVGAAATLLLLACGACTLLLDRTESQCHTDDDCAHFGGHPYCQNGLCVPSGLGPKDCFFGSPQRPQDFANQCSAASCVAVDDCGHLGLCGAAGDLSAPLAPPPDAGSGAGTPGDGGAADGSRAPTLPACADPASGRSQVIYMTGSSNFPPLLAKLAPLVLATGFTPVFQVTSSCAGVRSIFGADPSDRTIHDPAPSPNAKYASYFQADGTSVKCLLGPDGASVDVGESDLFSSTCDGFGPPDGTIGEYFGPIQAMAFVVPGKSRETAISAEAARAVFGNGGAGPWSDPSLFFVRNAGTGTQQMVAHAIDVPASGFWGVDRGTAANVDGLMRVIADDGLAQQAIGIISVDYADDDRANLKALAFRAAGQTCAYLPDSTEFRRDKRNVRDGHYPIWGPVHFFAAVSNGVPVSPAAQAFVSVVSVPNVQQALLDAFIDASLVPGCAMQVQRDSELGALSPYSPPFQCGCYFESRPSVNGAASPECTKCATANDCTDPNRPACNLGYCEVQ